MADRFIGLLWGDLLIGLLLEVAGRPDPAALATRARGAAEAFLRLYPAPDL
jgi:hypothetical protein